jgi:hypothetical protein
LGLAACVLWAAASTAFAQRGASGPAALKALAEDGAPGLALQLIERRQPDRLRDPTGWLRWEEVRWAVLAEGAAWARLDGRIDDLPPGLPTGFLERARLHQARARLALGHTQSARAAARHVIWAGAQPASAEGLAEARLLIIESYLVDEARDDARAALLRHRRDYAPAAHRGQERYARLLLRVGEYVDAGALLAGAEDARAQALALLAGLRAGTLEAAAVTERAQALAEAKETPAADRARLWALAAEAAARLGQGTREVWCLERALIASETPIDDPLFAFGGDVLWEAYLRIGQTYGNRDQLLIGDDAAWLDAAERAQEARGIVRGRALLAVVALEGSEADARARAHRRLAASLLAESEGVRAVEGLYLHAERFAEVGRIPEGLRHFLVDRALADGRLELASALIADLAEPPADVDPFTWTLKRARVLVLAGREDAGIDALYELLAALPSLPAEPADRLLQVVFDLQSVQRHEAAINLFVVLMPRLEEPRQRRELLFWQADSYKALGQYEQAAWLYLRSATLLDRHAYDPWAQTSRYNAAEALTEAGLIADARRLYRDLLSAAREPERRALLRQRLQALELLD